MLGGQYLCGSKEATQLWQDTIHAVLELQSSSLDNSFPQFSCRRLGFAVFSIILCQSQSLLKWNRLLVHIVKCNI